MHPTKTRNSRKEKYQDWLFKGVIYWRLLIRQIVIGGRFVCYFVFFIQH